MALRARIRSVILGIAAAGVAAGAAAQSFPSKQITVVMPTGPTTAFYIMLRQMADQIQSKTGRTIVFDPVLGANGTLAPAKVRRADADGHTIGLTYAAPMTINPMITKDPQYDPLKDFAYITMLTRHGIYFVAGANVPFNNLQEMIALAKAKPGTVRIGQGATGSRIGIIMLQEAAGVQFLDVPYKSSAQFDAALLSGEIDVALSTVGTSLGQVRAGRMKGIVIGSKNRSPLAPTVGSVSELYPNVEIVSWFALFAPAGTPPERIDWHHREWLAQLKDPKVAERMTATFGYDIVASTPQELLDQIRREIPINARIVRQYGISE